LKEGQEIFCGPQPLGRRHKTVGQDVSLEYRRHARNISSGAAQYPKFSNVQGWTRKVLAYGSKAAAPAGGANAQESSVKTAISRTFPEGRSYSGEPERFYTSHSGLSL